MKAEALRLYLVTDRGLAGDKDIMDIVVQAVKGGTTMVQLREKDCDTRDFVELAIEMKKALEPYGVPLIINDRVDVALASDADGVHIGQSDMPYHIARRLLGPDKIIGLSVESMDDIIAANELDVDYIGISPVYGTPTKTDTHKAFGLDGLKEAVRLSVHPSCGIGGMNLNTAASVMACGTDGIAVVSAIVCADDPCEASRQLLEQVNAGLERLDSEKTLNDNSDAGQKWSESVWQKAAGLYGRIISHPFLTQLAAGTLDRERFVRYLCQDEIYLGDYAAHMDAVADMLSDRNQQQLFRDFAREGMESEKLMHTLLIDRWGIDTGCKASAITTAYDRRICAALATGDAAVALAAVLPCAWVYHKVGMHIYESADLQGNPYADWIREYASEQFESGVRMMLDIVDSHAAQASQQTIEQMDKAFMDATLLEYAFWDYAYNGPDANYDYIKTTEE